MVKSSLGFTENSDKDVLSAYREKLLHRLETACIVLFLPVSIFNIIKGHSAIAAALGVVVALITFNTIATYFKRRISFAPTVYIVGLVVAVSVALLNRGAYGTYWTYPTVIFICFSVTHRLAKIYTALFFAYCCFLNFYLLDFELAMRSVVGLLVTILFTHTFLGIIEKLQEKLIKQSASDPLTGALNRRQLNSSLEEAIERKRRTHTPASILVFDIDNFKSINDNYGHAVGDHVLKEFVALVSRRARRLDQLFRTGGEEFMLFLPDTPESGALMLAEDIRVLIAEAEFIENRPVTVSIGLSELAAGETLDDWIKCGDNALYLAKENGRNQVSSRLHQIDPNHLMIGEENLINASV